MKRITPEEVLDAYAKTGLKPCRVWSIDMGDGSCCAVGAMRYAAGVDGDPHEYIDKSYGYQYRIGFTFGFDDYGGSVHDESEMPDWTDERKMGYSDGLAAASAVFQGSK
jgi:hypothetical protein